MCNSIILYPKWYKTYTSEEFKTASKEKNDTLFIGHGFYLSQLKIRILKKMEYLSNGKNHYKNGKIIKFNKAIG